MVDPSLLLSMMLSITVLDLFAFLLQNLLYEINYELLIKKINGFLVVLKEIIRVYFSTY